MVDNHTHLDIARDGEPAAGRGGGDRAPPRRSGSTGWCRSAATCRGARFTVESSTSTRRCSAGWRCTPTRRRGWPSAASWTRRTTRSSELAAHPRVRVIGETGLDYFRTGPEGVAAQQDSFRWHIDLAKRTGKALQIHDRDAHDDVLRILEEEGAPETTVLHCFSGDVAMARDVRRARLLPVVRRDRDLQERPGPARRPRGHPAGAGPRRDRRALPDPGARGAGRPTRRTSCRSPSGRWRGSWGSPCPPSARPSAPTPRRSTAPGDPARRLLTRRYAGGRQSPACRLAKSLERPLPKFDLCAERPVMVDDCWPGSDPPGRRERGCSDRQDGGPGAPLSFAGPARRPGRDAPPMPGELDLWSIVITRPVRRIAQAAVVTTLVAGAVGVSHFDKSVTLSVDGKASTVHAFGSTVGDVLAKQDIKVGEHDVVVPGRRHPDRRRPEDRRPLRPQADRHRRRQDARLLDHRHDGGGRPPGAGHPRRLRQAVGLALADPGPRRASRSAVTTPKAVVVHVDGKNLTGRTHRPHRQGRRWASSRSRVDARRPGQAGPDLRRRPAGMQIAIQRVTAKTVQRHPGHRVRHTARSGLRDLYKGQTQDGHRRHRPAPRS